MTNQTQIQTMNDFYEKLPKLQAGQKVYHPAKGGSIYTVATIKQNPESMPTKNLFYLKELSPNFVFYMNEYGIVGSIVRSCVPEVVPATTENYEYLSALYPHINFQKPKP